MEDKLQVKRKSRTLAGKQREACGIWLDASALKKRKLQNLIGKSALRLQSQPPSSYFPASRVSSVRTKQTTISTFFRTQPAEERETDRSPIKGSSSVAGVSSPHFPAGGENAPPAPVIHSIETEKRSQQHAEKPHGCAPWKRHPAQARCDSHAGEEYPFSLDLTQPWEEKMILDHPPVSEPPLREKNSDRRREKPIPSSSPHSPELGIPPSKRASKSQRRARGSDSENVNPQLEKRGTHGKPLGSFRESACGPPGKSHPPACTLAPRTEDSQASGATSLFTQDSEGYKVIAHHFARERGMTPLPGQPLRGRSSPSPPRKDGSGACHSAEQRPRASPGTTLSVLADISQKSCYGLLFTEDSEGNKVIKH